MTSPTFLIKTWAWTAYIKAKMKQLLVHPGGRREGCMIGVSGVSVTVSVRALVSSGCSNPEKCIYVYICSFFPECLTL